MALLMHYRRTQIYKHRPSFAVSFISRTHSVSSIVMKFTSRIKMPVSIRLNTPCQNATRDLATRRLDMSCEILFSDMPTGLSCPS